MKRNILVALVVVLVIIAVSVIFANVKKARLARLNEEAAMQPYETTKVVIPQAPSTATISTESTVGIKTADIEKTQATATTTATATLPADRNKMIQTALKNANLYTGEIDGKIGPMTKKAIEEFQKLKGLKVDGKVGQQTWAALRDYLPTETTE